MTEIPGHRVAGVAVMAMVVTAIGVVVVEAGAWDGGTAAVGMRRWSDGTPITPAWPVWVLLAGTAVCGFLGRLTRSVTVPLAAGGAVLAAVALGNFGVELVTVGTPHVPRGVDLAAGIVSLGLSVVLVWAALHEVWLGIRRWRGIADLDDY